jgi:hypothetical protein
VKSYFCTVIGRVTTNPDYRMTMTVRAETASQAKQWLIDHVTTSFPEFALTKVEASES